MPRATLPTCSPCMLRCVARGAPAGPQAEVSPEGSDSDFAAQPSKAAAVSAGKAAASASASASSGKRVRKQVDYHAAEHKNDAMETSGDECASARVQPRGGQAFGCPA